MGITSDGFFSLKERPEKVVVVGAGYIAVEMAQVNSRSGPSSGQSWIYYCRDEPC